MSFHSKKFRVDLSTARDNARIDIKGGFVRVVGASSPTAQFDVAVDNNIGTNDQFTMQKTDALTYGPGFEKIYITNAAQANEWIEFVVTPSKEVFDFEVGQDFFVSGIAGTVTVEETKAETFATFPDVALANGVATLLIAASTSRRQVHISNLVANGVPIRVGDASVGAARGAEVGIGSTYIIDTSDDVYAFVGSAGKSVGISTVSD